MTISPINNHAEQQFNLNIPCSVFVTSKKQSFWNKHETIIGITVSIAAIATAVFFYAQFCQPKPGCVEGFYDDWTDSICKNGEFTSLSNRCHPNLIKFKKLIDQCISGAQILGCLDGKFYRELTQECKDNPVAALCDGKYDYQDFLKEVNIYSNPMCIGCCID